MMQATTALSLKLPVMMCLPVQFRFLTKSQYFTYSKLPLTREIMRAPLMSAQWYVEADVPTRYTRMTRTSDLSCKSRRHVACRRYGRAP
jgi:hypothetical protein